MSDDQRGSATEPFNLSEALKNRTYATYQARLCAHQRLVRRNNAWNAALIALSTSTTIASIGMLVDKAMYGKGGDALMVALAVLSLVASLVVSSVNYAARARSMEAGYKRIQQISIAAEHAHYAAPEATRIEAIQHEYNMAIDSSENHSTADHVRAGGSNVKWKKWVRTKDFAAGASPYLTLAVPIALIIPFVAWFINGL